MSPQTLRAIAYRWYLSMNTADIAKAIGKPESEVYNQLPEARRLYPPTSFQALSVPEVPAVHLRIGAHYVCRVRGGPEVWRIDRCEGDAAFGLLVFTRFKSDRRQVEGCAVASWISGRVLRELSAEEVAQLMGVAAS